MASKKQGTRATARSPIDFVLVAGSVRVQQSFISWNEFSRIDFGGRLQSCLGCGRQLIKPSESAFRANFKSVNVSVSVGV